jgi:hypothetical protein
VSIKFPKQLRLCRVSLYKLTKIVSFKRTILHVSLWHCLSLIPTYCLINSLYSSKAVILRVLTFVNCLWRTKIYNHAFLFSLLFCCVGRLCLLNVAISGMHISLLIGEKEIIIITFVPYRKMEYPMESLHKL